MPSVSSMPTTSTMNTSGTNALATIAQQQQENLPCPRCDSTNTKFCYYNNYNFSQPRHLCKSCRRYWTHGGTLRDIPVGGATRKNPKRSRTTKAAALCSSPQFEANDVQPCSSFECDDHEDVAKVNGSSCSFTSLLNSQGVGVGPDGFWSLGGLGLGLGIRPDVELGPTRFGLWPLSGLTGDGGAPAGLVSNNGGGGAIIMTGNTWQFESGENEALVNGSGAADLLSWPDLAISTRGAAGLK